MRDFPVTTKLKQDVENMVKYKMLGDWDKYHAIVDRLIAEMEEFRYNEQQA